MFYKKKSGLSSCLTPKVYFHISIILFIFTQFHVQQITGFSSKVEVIPETTIIAGASPLSTGTGPDNGENSGMFAALRGVSGSNEQHSQIRGTPAR